MTSTLEFVGPRRNTELLFAFAVTIVGCLYVVLVPLASYLTGTLMATFDSEMPVVVAALIPLSPWLPLGIGSICIGTLFWKRRSRGVSRTVTYFGAASAVVFGILWVVLTLLPALQLTAALPE